MCQAVFAWLSAGELNASSGRGGLAPLNRLQSSRVLPTGTGRLGGPGKESFPGGLGFAYPFPLCGAVD